MSTMMDVLQCLGVEPEIANRFYVQVLRELRTESKPTFLDMYGGGSICEAAAAQRNLRSWGAKKARQSSHNNSSPTEKSEECVSDGSALNIPLNVPRVSLSRQSVRHPQCAGLQRNGDTGITATNV